jgi:predicted transcriptional regulator
MCVRRQYIVADAAVDRAAIWQRRQRNREGRAVPPRGFGDLEAVVMDRIWNRQETTTVREIFDELAAEREIAYTTVMSTMDNLHTKGWLAREREGKAYRYWPTLTRAQHSAQLMREALDAGGSSELVLSHFLEQISPEESARLRDALRRVTKRAGGK